MCVPFPEVAAVSDTDLLAPTPDPLLDSHCYQLRSGRYIHTAPHLSAAVAHHLQDIVFTNESDNASEHDLYIGSDSGFPD